MKAMNNNQQQSFQIARMDEMEWILFRKNETKRQLNRSRNKIRENYEKLTRKDEIPSDKWGKTAYFLSKSGTIVNGLRIGLKVGRAINTLVKLKRNFTRR